MTQLIRFLVTLACVCSMPIAHSTIAQETVAQETTSKKTNSQKSVSKKQPAPKPIINQRALDLNEQGTRAMQSKDYKKAEDLFEKSLAIDTKNVTAAFNLAGAYMLNGKTADAIDLLNQYVKDYTSDPGLYSRLGEAYFANKDLPNAETNLEKALELFPEYPGVALKLATVYSLQAKLNEAEGAFLVAAQQDPKNGSILSNLANIYLANKKFDDAISASKRALQIKPSSDVYITMSVAYENLNDYQNAVIALQRALDLGNTKEEVKQHLEDLKKKALEKVE